MLTNPVVRPFLATVINCGDLIRLSHGKAYFFNGNGEVSRSQENRCQQIAPEFVIGAGLRGVFDSLGNAVHRDAHVVVLVFYHAVFTLDYSLDNVSDHRARTKD